MLFLDQSGNCDLKEVCLDIQQDVTPISQRPYRIPLNKMLLGKLKKAS